MDHHFFTSSSGSHLFLTHGSEIHDLASGVSMEELRPARAVRMPKLADLPGVRAISLNVAQACNLACSYCYAGQGRFGGAAKLMPLAIAKATVDRLIENAEPGARLLVGFMGGEPLLARGVIHKTVDYAVAQARRAKVEMRFSITTNGTLIEPADVRLFAQHPFAVQVSLDGEATVHDSQRPTAGKQRATHADIVRRLDLFRTLGRPRSLSARATVVRGGSRLIDRLRYLVELGFDDVGFAPATVNGDGGLDRGEFLAEMIECGEESLGLLLRGEPSRFSNLETALGELHRGTARPYSCGAGAGYLSSSAGGDLFACHRFVDEPAYRMGDIRSGYDDDARGKFLARSHVDDQAPCGTCWARYLCGGGCHHEVALQGRDNCDYIRGWLSFCLSAYVQLHDARPDYFRFDQGR